jgi:flagellar biosynthesis protein FlhA
MFRKNRMEYVIKTCSAEDAQDLQNLLNEMSMNGWELYSMHEVGDEESADVQLNCIFMREAKTDNNSESDIINISDFKSQMEKMLSPKMTEYEQCLQIQSKIRHEKEKINKIKAELEGEAPASVSRKKLNDKISAGLKELEDLKAQLNKATSPDLMYSKLHEEKLTIYLSEELLGFIDSDRDNSGEELVAETVKARLKLTEENGYVIPKVVFKDDENLNSCEFSIRIRGMEVFRAGVCPNYLMFYSDELHLEHKIKGSIDAIDNISDRKVVWIEKDKAKDFWQKGITPSEYIAKALEYVSIKYVDDLMDYDDIDKYLEVVEKENEFLIENIVPDLLTYSDIKYILTSLIKECVSIKNITYIFEKINDFAEEGSKADILNKIRLSLSRQICKAYTNEDGETISAFELSEKSYSEIVLGCDEGEDSLIKIDGEIAETLANKLIKKSKKLGVHNPRLIVPMDFRQIFFTLLSLYMNNITVLAQEEVSCLYKIDSLGEI